MTLIPIPNKHHRGQFVINRRHIRWVTCPAYNDREPMPWKGASGSPESYGQFDRGQLFEEGIHCPDNVIRPENIVIGICQANNKS
jgi:hypothetical protein